MADLTDVFALLACHESEDALTIVASKTAEVKKKNLKPKNQKKISVKGEGERGQEGQSHGQRSMGGNGLGNRYQRNDLAVAKSRERRGKNAEETKKNVEETKKNVEDRNSENKWAGKWWTPKGKAKISEALEKYSSDIHDSEGFDVGVYPALKMYSGLIRRFYDPPSVIRTASELDELTCLSERAIDRYNAVHDTNYQKVKVLKAMRRLGGSLTHYITFEARDKTKRMFQAKTVESIPFFTKTEVKFVRMI